MVVNYVPAIEPRLTAHRPATPTTTTETLVEWLLDLEQEAVARLELLTDAECGFSPHPDANDADVTFWHIARWLDVLAATGAVTAPKPSTQVWHRDGFADEYGYDPTGIGYLGLGTLTGYTPGEMRAVPRLGPAALTRYLRASTTELCEVLTGFDAERINHDQGFGSPYQIVGGTLQGSFGHLGEIDCLVALQARLNGER
ncbi:DinB family protein [Actinomadura viridis]|uniref:DinB family protein n=1 Tax=Actinomadura viridis TaxID=58110 RepID=UPI0036C285E7